MTGEPITLQHRPRTYLGVVGVALLVAGIAVAAYWYTQRTVAPSAVSAIGAAPTAPPRITQAPKDPATVAVCTAARAADASDLAAAAALGSRAADLADYEVKFQGAMLRDRAQLAIAARGARDETALKLDVFTQILRLQTACTKGRYE